MKRYLIYALTVTTFLTAILIVILVYGGKDPVVISSDYCEDYPDALVCNNGYASEHDIVEDMFQRILVEGDDTLSENYCDSHFANHLATYCKDEVVNVLPSDFYRISSNIGVVEKEEGIYTVTTKYYDNTQAYYFNVSLVLQDGYYKFGGFSYEFPPEVTNLEYTGEDLNVLMNTLLTNQDDPDFCNTYFIENAYYDCIELKSQVAPVSFSTDTYLFEEMDVNEYRYIFDDTENDIRYRITADFRSVNGNDYIYDIQVISTLIEE